MYETWKDKGFGAVRPVCSSDCGWSIHQNPHTGSPFHLAIPIYHDGRNSAGRQTYITGEIANQSEKPGYGRLLAANFAGLAIVYLFGMAYYYWMSNFYLGTPIGLWPLFLYCFILAVPGDIALCILGAILGQRLIPLLNGMGRET